MHALHTILVEFDGEEGSPADATPEAARARARALAEEAIEAYRDDVFDWYAVEGAGRWSARYPTALIGSEGSAKFLTTLEEARLSPLQAAKDALNDFLFQDVAFREPEEARQQDYEEFEPHPLMQTGRDPNDTRVMSGKRLAPPTIDEAYLEAAFASDDEYPHAWISLAINLAVGEYSFWSGFYSVPDYSAKLSSETRERVTKHPEHYALVFMDLHI